MTARMTFRVYLDSGAVLEFKAEDMKTTRRGDELESVEWVGMIGHAVRYINLDRIVAITREVK